MARAETGRKWRSLALLVIAEITTLSVWFIAAAVLPDMVREAELTPARRALLSSGVQAGFVAGALAIAITGLADRVDPRRLFAASGLAAAMSTLALLFVPVGGDAAVACRILTGALLAGVYPVGMKIAAGWGQRDRGFLVGLLVGALTLGSAMPNLFAFLGGAHWRAAIVASALTAGCGALAILFAGLGPHHARAARFAPDAVVLAWRDRRIRYATAGYLGHMWELYAMWTWIGAAATASYAMRIPAGAAEEFGKLTAFLAIAVGAPFCLLAGRAADRIGKGNVTIAVMAASGTAAVLTALSFGGPVWLVFALVLVWGATVIPDSAQFSALVADAAPASKTGSLLTLQTALGFGLTVLTVHLVPIVVARAGWQTVLALLALGPLFGIAAMLRHRRLEAGPDRPATAAAGRD